MDHRDSGSGRTDSTPLYIRWDTFLNRSCAQPTVGEMHYSKCFLKGLSYEIDLENVYEDRKILALITVELRLVFNFSEAPLIFS